MPLHRAGDRAAVSEEQPSRVAFSVKPDPSPGIPVAVAHRNQPDVGRARRGQRAGDQFAYVGHADRAKPVAARILADKGVGAATDRR